MAENQETSKEAGESAIMPDFNVASSPHLSDTSVTTFSVMRDVLIGLIPLIAWSIYLFKGYAAMQLAICVGSCLVFEALFTWLRKRPVTLSDCTAAITGVILALSLPANAPWYVGVIGSAVGVGVGKAVFGGIGYNLFNPAMVGRAFIMLSFAGAMGGGGYVMNTTQTTVDALTTATPLTQAQGVMKAVYAGTELPVQQFCDAKALFIGSVNGSLGEISAICIILGGLYLCIRKVAAWQIPAGAIVALVACSFLGNVAGITQFTVLQHLLSGAFLFGAFFIATDPVSSPMSRPGRFCFGIGYGLLVMALRLFSSYPEGVMFAVLIMNSLVPIINRFTVPTPVGGPVPQRA